MGNFRVDWSEWNGNTSLESGEDFLDPGEEKIIDPPDYYLANPRSTVVLLGR